MHNSLQTARHAKNDYIYTSTSDNPKQNKSPLILIVTHYIHFTAHHAYQPAIIHYTIPQHRPYRTTSHYTAINYTALHYTNYTTLHYTTLHYITLTTLHYTTLHYTALHCIPHHTTPHQQCSYSKINCSKVRIVQDQVSFVAFEQIPSHDQSFKFVGLGRGTRR